MTCLRRRLQGLLDMLGMAWEHTFENHRLNCARASTTLHTCCQRLRLLSARPDCCRYRNRSEDLIMVNRTIGISVIIPFYPRGRRTHYSGPPLGKSFRAGRMKKEKSTADAPQRCRIAARDNVVPHDNNATSRGKIELQRTGSH